MEKYDFEEIELWHYQKDRTEEEYNFQKWCFLEDVERIIRDIRFTKQSLLTLARYIANKPSQVTEQNKAIALACEILGNETKDI